MEIMRDIKCRTGRTGKNINMIIFKGVALGQVNCEPKFVILP